MRRLDDEVGRRGWRILLITRLVPVFPFNLQNYAYGLTRIPLGAYVLHSPHHRNLYLRRRLHYERRPHSHFGYLGVATVFFVILSLIPDWYRKRRKEVEG